MRCIILNNSFDKFIFLFLNIFYIILNLEVNADYLLDQFEENKNDLPKIKLKNENIKNQLYPEYNTDIGDFLIVKVFGLGDPGNGVLIAQNGDNYYVLTSSHIIQNLSEGMELKIQTIDTKEHIAKILKKSTNYDSSLISFKSKNYYYTSIIKPNIKAFKGLKVELVGYSLPSIAVNKVSLRKTSGEVIGVLKDNTDGYNVLYSNPTNVGMSGSGVFTYPKNKFGIDGHAMRVDDPCRRFLVPTLIAIHGRGEEYLYGGKSGVNLGISIHSLLNEFKSELAKEGIDSLPNRNKTRIWKDGCPLYKENWIQVIRDEYK